MVKSKVGIRPALKWLLAALVALCAVWAVAMPQSAWADEEAVRADRSGVMKLNWGIDGVQYSRGSCFLINEDTVVTAYHATFFSEGELEVLLSEGGPFYGQSIQDLRDRCTYTVTVRNDTQVGATLMNASERQDFAILKLDQSLNNHNALKLRDSSTVTAPSAVYALGFPGNSDLQALNDYTAEDVTIRQGSVNKPEGNMHYLTDTLQECNGIFLQTDVSISEGDSGGPMVDSNGSVIGVSVASDDNYYFAAASSEIIKTLDDLQYEFVVVDENGNEIDHKNVGKDDDEKQGTEGEEGTGSDGDDETGSDTGSEVLTPDLSKLNAAIDAAKDKDSAEFTEESYAAMNTALEEAKKLQEKEYGDIADQAALDDAQEEIDAAAEKLDAAVKALEPKEAGLPMAAIIGIIVGAIALIGIILAIVLLSKRNKKDQAPAAAPTPVGVPAGAPVGGYNAPMGQMPTYDQGAPETTVLGGDSAETTVLNQSAHGGTLTRMSTNETITINSADFSIGRERNKVSYCLEGNTSISRLHARIVVRNGNVYLIDNNAANGTYVNGVKSRSGQEVQLKSGDIIMLADEKFRYNA